MVVSNRERHRVRRMFPTVSTWVLLTFLSIGLWRLLQVDWSPPSALPNPDHPHLVIRVIDGDTIEIAGGHRVRLIGVDTPETVHPDRPEEPFGSEASAFTRSKVEGQEVRIEFDRERVDSHGRLLAFVFIHGECLNELLIREGLSPAVTTFSYRAAMKRRFVAAEATAKGQRRGLWSIDQ